MDPLFGEKPGGRSFVNDWHDAIIGEIELGSMQAYMAMAVPYDVGISMMHIEFIFSADDGDLTEMSPWGPWGEFGG